MRKLFYMALGLAIAAGGFLAVILIRDYAVRGELDTQLSARYEIEAFAREAPQGKAWTNPATVPDNAYPQQATADSEERVYGSFTAPEGFVLESLSRTWDDDMMESLYEELMANVHGQEIYYLDKVVVHAGGEQTDVLGMQQENATQYEIRLSHPTLLPYGLSLNLETKATTIHLYNGDSRTTIESMAGTLSHEYGHHFTNYYFFDMDRPQAWLSSEYAEIRDLPPGRVYGIISDYDDYIANHRWYIQEIAADDYVVLMGSPATRQTLDFYDVYDWMMSDIRGTDIPDYSSQTWNAFNAVPHENISIAFPTEVDGLTAFFYSFVDTATPTWPLHDQAITITIKPRSKGYQLVTGYKTYRYYEITWNCPYQSGNPLYTLICYDENDELAATIKTVGPDEKGKAIIGNAVYETSKVVYNLDDGLTKGVKRFRVTVVFDDGSVYVSDPLQYDFGG